MGHVVFIWPDGIRAVVVGGRWSYERAEEDPAYLIESKEFVNNDPSPWLAAGFAVADEETSARILREKGLTENERSVQSDPTE